MPDNRDPVQPPFGRPTLGKVCLVGAGPGDPGLLTLRGRECLESADVVLFDGLANEDLLEFAAHAECISVGKHGQIPLWTQADINRRLVELASAGQQVVRLKGGDPAVFARTAEEQDVLRRAGIEFEVVPGITAALAAASYTGIPITHRDYASAVAFITGQQQDSNEAQGIDWDALARFPGTLVFYMGVTTVGIWTAKLLEAGKPADTPAAIVRRCTWSDQTVVRCQLGSVAGHLTPASKMRPPVIVILGEVAALGEDLNWFDARPLRGCGVWVTRTREQSGPLTSRLRALGAQVFRQPVLDVKPPADPTSLQAALAALCSQQVDGVTFSSAHGVDGLLGAVVAAGYDARIFAGVKLAAVGITTAARLRIYGLRCDLAPGNSTRASSTEQQPQPQQTQQQSTEQSAVGLLRLMDDALEGQRWLVTTTNRSRSTLAAVLEARGAAVSECLAYETASVPKLTDSIAAALDAGRIQFATVTSAFVAESTHRLLGSHQAQVRPICFSPAIATAVASLGWPAAAVAEENSIEATVAAVIAAYRCPITQPFHP